MGQEGESGTVDKSDARFDEKHAPSSSGREGRRERDSFETGEEEDSCSSKPDAEVTEGGREGTLIPPYPIDQLISLPLFGAVLTCSIRQSYSQLHRYGGAVHPRPFQRLRLRAPS